MSSSLVRSLLAAGEIVAIAAIPPAAPAQSAPAAPPAASAAAAAAAAPSLGCSSDESRQFDFWVGSWDVYAGATPEQKVAESVIEKLYLGCAIRENWMPLRGGGNGGSLSAYVAADKGWRQTWVDASGSWAEFRGGRRGEAMVLQGSWPVPGMPNQITRMTYTVLPDNAVRQAGETSNDDGKTFQPAWSFIYRRAAR